MELTKSYTESELVLSLRNKDDAAFSYLYDNYSGALNGTINMIVKDKDFSEDTLQEVFIRIWNNIDSYDETKGKLFTWMKKIAHNIAIDTVKSKQFRQQAITTSEEDVTCKDAVNNSGFDKLNQKDFKNKLETLDTKQKQIIDLSYFQGYTQQEIAEELDMPLGTVKTKIRTAIIELRKIFNYN